MNKYDDLISLRFVLNVFQTNHFMLKTCKFFLYNRKSTYILLLLRFKRCINIKLRKNILLNQYVYENCIKYLQLIKYQYIKY